MLLLDKNDTDLNVFEHVSFKLEYIEKTANLLENYGIIFCCQLYDNIKNKNNTNSMFPKSIDTFNKAFNILAKSLNTINIKNTSRQKEKELITYD